MKTNNLKLTIGLFLASLGYAQAQNGLENVVVEKYYVANAADAAAATASGAGVLPVGSVTYRVYADMLPGYNIQSVYGDVNHALKITSSTTFFNDEFRGNTIPSNTVNNTKAGTVGLDSYFSFGSTAVGKVGVLRSEDGDGTMFTSSTVLINDGADFDPISGVGAKDGNITGTIANPGFIGFDPASGIFDAVSQQGGSFITNDGAYYVLGGVSGPTAANRVLIGQFTTDGDFGFELNIQVGTPSGGAQNFVSGSPVGAEIALASLRLAPNLAPTVTVSSPATAITGDVVALTATAADSDGSVAQVEFFVDGISVGVDASSPFAANYTAVLGNHSVTAVATDNQGATKTSTAVALAVANNQAPTVSVSNAANAIVGDVVTVTATAADADGSVATVEFFVDNVSVGTDNSSPFTYAYTAVVGSHTFKAIATDNRGLATTSANSSISVANNIPATVSLTSPASNATFTAPAVVTIDATAADADGSVSQVEFFVNNVSVGVDNTSPYSVNWTSAIGAASFTAKATDNKGAITTSAAINLTIADPNALPYGVGTVTATCLPTTVCLPVLAADTVHDVIGYDLVLAYDATKLTPTGVITKGGDLATASQFDVINQINGDGTINISAFFNLTAPANATFDGIGELFCVEFTKTGAFQSVDTAVVSISNLEESYITSVSTKLASAGKYITYKDSIFNGTLRFMGTASPVQYNAGNPNDHLITNIYGNNSSCTTKGSVAVQPDLAGKFTYSINNGLSINIEKDILATTDVQPVVNGFDALQVRKVILKDVTFTPSIYQIIAMDVNEDGQVSAGDVTQINQRTVLLIPEFKQAWNYNNQGVKIVAQPSKDWIFVDSLLLATSAYQVSATFPNNDGTGFSKARVPQVAFCQALPVANFATCATITDNTYKGILLGDVNGNFLTASPNSAFKTENSDVVLFDVANAVSGNGYVDVPVSISSNNAVNALDFSMQFNNNLSFSSVVNNASMESLSHFNNDDQTLRFTSNSLEEYTMNQAVVYVRFNVNEGHQLTASDLLTAQAYLNGDSAKTVIAGKTDGLVEFAKSQNISVYPNPASSGVLNVLVSENAIFELLDMNGKLVVSQSVLANVKQEINVENLANGVYSIRIQNDEFISTQRVVINK